MPPFGVAVTMSKSFRGAAELFSHVFHYDYAGTEGAHDGVADAVVAGLRETYTADIAFKQVRVWGPTDQGKLVSVTQLIKDLAGSGTGAGSGSLIYPELAIHTQFYVGRNPATGRKRFLRKYWRPVRLRVDTHTDPTHTLLSQAEKDYWLGRFEAMKNLTVNAGNIPICTPQGDHLPLNTSATIGNRLQIRQLKQ